MNKSVLMVDDEQRVLDGLRRILHGRFELTTASSGAEALLLMGAAVSADAPFAVLVSDMKMPGMDGAELLTEASTVSPDTVQLILSGQADLTSTVAAVNDANLFRFLTKPCDPDVLARALVDALRQHQLVTTERDLIDRTLNGAIEVLTELMSSSSPAAFARTARIRAVTVALADLVTPADVWELRLAAMLSQIGVVAVPSEIVEKLAAGDPVSDAEAQLYAGHPRLAQEMLRRIPRLERIADWVGDQATDLDEARPPAALRPVDSPETGYSGQAVFSTVMAFLAGTDRGRGAGDIRKILLAVGYPAPLVDAVAKSYAGIQIGRIPQLVRAVDLIPGMVLNQNVVTTGGLTLLRSGEPVTRSLVIRLRHFANTVGLVEPISVLVDQLSP